MDHIDRREYDRKWRDDLLKRLDELDGRLEIGLEKLGDEVEKLKEAVVGGLDTDDGLKVKFSHLDKDFNETRALVASIAKTLHGDVLGRNSLVDLVKQAVKDADEAKKIAEGKAQHQTAKRGQNLSVWVAVIAAFASIAVASVSHWEKIERIVLGKKETPTEWAERIRRDIEKAEKEFGPEIRKKLRDIEKARRSR